MNENDNSEKINEKEYINDIENYQELLQRFTGNLLKKMQVDQIKNNITAAYDDYPLDYEEGESSPFNKTEIMTVDEINKDIATNDNLVNTSDVIDTKFDIYECDRCGYKTKSRLRFKRHLNRKKPCKVTKKNIEIAELKQRYRLCDKIEYDELRKVIMIDSAKYPEDKNKYNICEYCNEEFTCADSYEKHTCDVKTTLTAIQTLEFDKLKLIHLIQKLCTDISLLRYNHGILLKDNILAHKMIDQYDKLLNKHNIPFNYMYD